MARNGTARDVPLGLGLALLTAALDEMEPGRAADLIVAIEGRDPLVGRELRRTFVCSETATDEVGDANGL